jgi:hypothetical protein
MSIKKIGNTRGLLNHWNNPLREDVLYACVPWSGLSIQELYHLFPARRKVLERKENASNVLYIPTEKHTH